MTIPRLFTVPPCRPFLPTLVDALASGQMVPGLSEENLGQALIYVPTRRAAKALAALLAQRAEKALLLPKIVALGEAEEAAFESEIVGGHSLRPAIPPLERRLLLARLVQKWAEQLERDRLSLAQDAPVLVPGSPADAVLLARDLEGLMDSLALEGIPWSDLARAVDAEYSSYFDLTLRFVRIAAEVWPTILEERQASDPAQRRAALIEAEAQRVASETRFVIGAGSTGSIPATARLLAAIAHHPKGAVFLPGLDRHLDEAGWNWIGAEGDNLSSGHGHPQDAMKRLLEHFIEAPRTFIEPLGASCPREILLSHALRPAETTDDWAALGDGERLQLAQEGLEGIALVEALNEREEALAAALALREALDVPEKTAALITPDRGLAARVAAELGRWGIEVEDSAGTPLSATPAGVLARLVAEAAAQNFSPASLVALLAHPCARLGLEPRESMQAVQALEIALLRGPAPPSGLAGLRPALLARKALVDRYDPLPRRRLAQEDWALAELLLERLEQAFEGFQSFERHQVHDLVFLSQAHREVVERVHAGAGEDDSFEALESLFDECQAGAAALTGRFDDYPGFFTALARERVLPPLTEKTHRRLKIFGPLEARLLDVDRVVLGGLDEGVWPPRCETDAFLNRPMRARIGLSMPERRIGQSAHDFVQALGVKEVIVTRAARRGKDPCVPSRFLQRLKAFCGEALWDETGARGDKYLFLARHIDAHEVQNPISRPDPKPDPSLIPLDITVSEAKTLLCDPYDFYARRILNLEPLEDLAQSPGQAERGSLIHEALGNFAKAYPLEMPAYALQAILQYGQQAFAELEEAFPQLYALWWPRFEHLAAQFTPWERERRSTIARLEAERSGRLAIALGQGRVLNLCARADRIEIHRDGSATIIDFKTGTPPSAKDILNGFAPQLTLEAMMLREGAFEGLRADAVQVLHVRVGGGREALEEKGVNPRGQSFTLEEVIAAQKDDLTRLMQEYLDGTRGFTSCPFPDKANRYSPYTHLARVKEWTLSGEDEE